jgi:hypothetical protein
MNFNCYKQSIHILPLLILVSVFYSSCLPKPADRKNISFKHVIGIHYTEVKRRLYNGHSFDNHGYEVDPEWKMFFMPKDSASVFSPDSNRFLTFPVTLDHDSLFNVGNTWLRAKKVTRDSMVFQVMQVETNVIYLLRSNVYMTFYADDYIKKNKLNLADLQKPDRGDTLFVKQRAILSNKYPDTIFAARNPVVLKSKIPLVKIEKEEVVASVMNRFNTSESYLNPIYDITIARAYQDFSYSFTVTVDVNGQMHFVKNLVYMFPEDKESTLRIIKGIIDGYLKAYIAVTPGNTLGIPHSSMITVNVVGSKK